jgi:hypothetical protein
LRTEIGGWFLSVNGALEATINIEENNIQWNRSHPLGFKTAGRLIHHTNPTISFL